ncbi:MAG: hypothetical protein RL685_790 [Pseudomonadota bacterium]
MLGLHLNTLPLRGDAAGCTFRELELRVTESQRLVAPHRWLPLTEMVKAQGGGLFSTAFSYIHFHVLGAALEELLPVSHAEEFTESNLELVVTFRVHPRDRSLALYLEAQAQRCSAAELQHVAELYLQALTALVEQPAGRVERWVEGMLAADAGHALYRSRAPGGEPDSAPSTLAGAGVRRAVAPAAMAAIDPVLLSTVCEVVAETLGGRQRLVPSTQIANLGIDSLKILRIIARLQRVLEVRLTVAVVLGCRTLLELARAVEQEREQQERLLLEALSELEADAAVGGAS